MVHLPFTSPQAVSAGGQQVTSVTWRCVDLLLSLRCGPCQREFKMEMAVPELYSQYYNFVFIVEMI